MSSSGSKIPLYVARSLAELNAIAAKDGLSSANIPRILANSSRKLFNEGERLFLDGDEEKSFVVYMRFLNLFQKVKNSSEYKKDKAYYDNIIGFDNVKTALSKAEKLGDSLKARYEELEAIEISKKLNALDDAASKKKEQPSDLEADNHPSNESPKNDPENQLPECGKKILDPAAPPGGVTVSAVYRLMNGSSESVLLLDVRCREDYSKSHIKSIDCVNVPADCLKPGTTVSQIEKCLPLESKVPWRNRSTVDYIILLDWKCSAQKLDPRGCVACLKDAMTKWDVETVLHNEPLILEGGYEEWLACYPAQTTNHQVTPPTSADDSSTVPQLDSIDYDVELGFLEDKSSKPPNIELQSNENGSVLLNSAQNVGQLNGVVSSTNVDSPSTVEITKRESASHGPPSAIPLVDRRTKPQLQPAKMNNAVENRSPNAKTNNDFSRLTNQLGEPGTRTNNASIESNKNSSSSAQEANSARQIPVLDRSTKPMGTKKTTNQDSAVESSRKQKELQELEMVKQQKAMEAQQLADLLRKKKKVEDELKILAQSKESGTIGSANGSPNYDASSSEDDETAMIPKPNNPKLDTTSAATGVKRNVSSKPEENSRFIQKFEDQGGTDELRRSKEEQRKEMETDLEMQRKLRAEAEEKVAALRKQAAEEAKREAEEKMRKQAAEEAKREAEEKIKKQAADKQALEEASRRKLEAEERMEAVKKKEAEEAEQKRLEKQLAEQKQREEKERQKKKEEDERNKQNLSRQQTEVNKTLPVHWECRWDAKSGRYYYINHINQTTQWDPPQPDNVKLSYKAPLKTDAAPQTSFGGGLTRSHSSPNIAKMMQDAEAEQAPVKSLSNTQLLPDRSTKPQSSQRITLHTEVSSAKVRNLQPTWGAVGKGLTGLRNLGNTCYMNSTIQCLSNTIPLTIYFLSDTYVADINRENSDGYQGQVADEFAVLIKALWSGQYRSVAPKDFRNVCCMMNSMFASSQHQDSQELLMYLMSALSEGLNKVRRKPTLPALETDNMEDEQAAELVWKQIHLKENSIVVDFFQGLYKSTVMCQTCDKKSVKFESFMYLTLPIPSPTRCSLADCLLHFSKESKLTGDSRWDCPRCRCKRDATVRLVIWRLPPILLIVLKRFHYEGIWRDKITTHVDFPVEGLDMSRYISGPKKRNVYNLFAVSNHYGMLDGGHYTAACRSAQDSRWYKYDDQEVSEISSSEIKSSAAYMLFYTSLKFDGLRI